MSWAPGCWAEEAWGIPAQLRSGSLEMGLTGRVWGGVVEGSPWNTLRGMEMLRHSVRNAGAVNFCLPLTGVQPFSMCYK